jgi:hypothetical protein
MHETLADIEALSLTCHSEQSKGYIAESIKCYQAGAYRASIVSTWVALVFDLTDKIRELSLAGDTAAITLQHQFESYIGQLERGEAQGFKSALEFERNILQTCKQELQFFDPQQFIDLSRLREDRHRCAHPSFQQVGLPFMPSAELARLHMRNTIVHVLSQPPVQGKAAVTRLLAVVSSNYFPKSVEEATTQLQANGLNQPTDALVKAFSDQLVLGFADINNTALFSKSSTLYALKAAYTLFPALVESRIRTQLNKAVRLVPDNELNIAAVLVAKTTLFTGTLIDQASIDKLKTFIDIATDFPAMAILADVPSLRERVEARVSGLDVDALVPIVNVAKSYSLVKPRALELLSQATQWGPVNDIINRLIIPIFDTLTPEDIIRIIHMPAETGADLRGANGFSILIENVRNEGLMTIEQLNPLLVENHFRPIVPPPPP